MSAHAVQRLVDGAWQEVERFDHRLHAEALARGMLMGGKLLGENVAVRVVPLSEHPPLAKTRSLCAACSNPRTFSICSECLEPS